jgi:TolB-like protein
MQMFRWAVLAGALSLGACTNAISGSADNISKLERAKASDPNSQVAVRNLGIAYFRAAPPRLAEARTALQQAMAMNPRDGVGALYLGLVAEAQNDLPAAKAAYESYVAFGKTRGVKNQINARLTVIARKENEENAKRAIAQEQSLSASPGPRTTVAVMPFRFTGTDTSLKPLERGMAELIVTDLSRASALKVVERTQLQALLDEISLQQQGVAAGTGVRVGKILQAGSLVGGSISQIQGDQLNTTANVTSVQTTQAIGSGYSGQSTLDQLFTAEKSIVLKLFEDLGVTLTTAERNSIEQRPTRSIAAFLAYSRGLELQDAGRFDDASRAYDNALRLDPGFVSAQQKSQEAKNAAAGATVTVATVENGLRGTAEGAAVSAANNGTTTSGSTSNAASSIAEGLNPSVAGGATQQGTTTVNPPALDVSAGTGGDNPSSKTAKVTIIIKQPPL